MLRFLLISFFILLLNVSAAFAIEDKAAPANTGITSIVEKALGKGVKIIRMDSPAKSRIEGLSQIRVWIETAYGETPVLFYLADDGRFYLAGSIYDAQGNNLTRLDVGTTKPRYIPESDMDLNKDYIVGDKDAPVKAVLWIGADAYSRGLFEAFYKLYGKNKNKIALYIKFFPKSVPDTEKMEASTCFRGEALTKALQIIYDANPAWGSKEDVAAFRKTGNAGACNDELVHRDLKLAETLRLPPHPVAFVNGVMLIEQPTKENIARLAGTELQ